MGHNYIRHNYMGHNYMGHNFMGHDHIGHNYIGHNHEGHNYMSGACFALISAAMASGPVSGANCETSAEASSVGSCVVGRGDGSCV